MKTELLTEHDVHRAAELLRSGGLVGIPTETVYGLGANGFDPEAVAHIFQAKGRPQDNPLILHIPEPGWLERCCQDIPAAAWTLAERFWPGPMTMILPRRPLVPDVVTAGLDTVGMRCPAHPLCRAIIAAADVPIAAPSGNTSGRPSPTTAGHMLEDMDGKIDAIVDGGPCAVGVESTIIDLTCTPPRLLRPGGVTLEQLQDALGQVEVDPAVTRLMGAGEQPKAPGMKYRHYAPKAPVTVVAGEPKKAAEYIAAHAAPDLQDHVSAVIRVPWQQEDRQLFLQLFQFFLGFRQFVLSHFLHFRVMEQLLRLPAAAVRRLIGPVGLHHRQQFLQFPVYLTQFLCVAIHPGIA